MQVDIEFFTGTKGISACETDLQLWTITAAATSDGITLNIEIIRFLEDAAQGQVKGIGVGSWGEDEVCRREHACGVDIARRLEVILVVELLARTHAHML